jgi:hypothetical protein
MFQHKYIHRHTWTARGQIFIIGYTVYNEKLADVVPYARVFQGSEIESDHYPCPICMKLR